MKKKVIGVIPQLEADLINIEQRIEDNFTQSKNAWAQHQVELDVGNVLASNDYKEQFLYFSRTVATNLSDEKRELQYQLGEKQLTLSSLESNKEDFDTEVNKLKERLVELKRRYEQEVEEVKRQIDVAAWHLGITAEQIVELKGGA